MTEQSKILLEVHNEEFRNYKIFIDKNNWYDDIQYNPRKGRLESPKLNTEVSIIDTIIRSTNKFKEDVAEDVDKKPVQNFIKFTSDIINGHIDRIAKYKKMHPLQDIGGNSDEEDPETSIESEVEFHSDLFALITKTKIALSKLKIDESEMARKSIDLFFGNAKAPLFMREYLSDRFPVIKDKTDNLGIDFRAPSINPATSNELLINMKPNDIPPWNPNKHFFEQDVSTIQFWEEERRKIINGVNIYGYHLSNWLYWHMNIFKMAFGGGLDKEVKNPLFRDNEFFFDHMYNKAKKHGRKGVFMYGTRRFAKSAGMTSRLMHTMWIVKNAIGTVQGFSKVPDLEALVTYADVNIQNMFPAMKIPANSLTLDDGIVLGLKGKKAQDRYDFANLSIVNLESGTTKRGSQKTAGQTPDAFLLDEALKHDEKVLTESGFINISGIDKGDKIYDDRGKLTTVIDKIDVGKKQLYKITFRNGVSIESCGDHLWEVKDKFNKGKLFVKKTSDLFKDFKVYGGRSKYSIRKTKPVEFTEKHVTIDPYFLGLWLGDGGKSSTKITTCDKYIIDYVESYSKRLNLKYEKYEKTDGNRKTATFDCGILKSNGKFNPLTQNLKKYGIYSNKRIPKEYLYNSVKTRLDLLRGILDTDGTVTKNGGCEIIQVGKHLSDDIVLLLESLGISAHMSEKVIKNTIYYRICFTTELDVFNLPRKKEKQRKLKSDKGEHNRNWTSIENIEKTTVDQAYCIKVDNDSKLFLTTMFTVTHNCGKGACIAPWKAALPSFAGGKGSKWRLVPLLSGCVCAGTKVYNHKGELINIEDLHQNEGIIGFDQIENKISKEPITWVQSPSEKPCYRITTKKGYSIECSYEHPILVRHRNKREKINGKWVRKREFIPTEELQLGQQIVINESVDIWGDKKMWNPRLIGWFICDGHYGINDIPSISSCDHEINDFISSNFKTSDKKKSYFTKEGELMMNRRLKGTARYLKELGIYGQTKCNKTLPLNIYQYSKKDICELIGGLFDTDGHVSNKGCKPQICFTSKCENLIIELKHLLNKIGIHPTYNKVISKPNKLVKIETEYFVLSIGDKRSINTFHDNINFKIRYKQILLEEAVKILHNYKERIPEELKNQRLDCISKIEYIGVKPIYNLTAGNTNTYIANQIVTHNTAGEGELSVDAEKMLKNPDTFHILQMDWDFLEEFIDPEHITWKRNTFGFFVPAQMSLEAQDKIIMPFSDFIGQPDNKGLSKIDIHVTDWKANKEFFEEKRKLVSNDLSMLAGEINSFPLDPEDCYITTEVNIFPGLESKKRKRFVEDEGSQGQKYRLYRDSLGVIQAESVPNAPIITDYPYNGGVFDAPVVMIENPLLQPTLPPIGLYCMGFDDVKHDKTDGDSVMSATIIKRSFEGGEWADRIVAYYDSRPDRKKDYYKTLHMLMKIYNVRLLHENADNGFIEYLESNYPDDVYVHVSESVGLSTMQNLQTNHNRPWGWTPTPHNIHHLNQRVVRYTKEEGVVIGNLQGLSGIDRINHPMLLEELYKYKAGKNADRLRSFGLALTLAEYYDKTYQFMKHRKKLESDTSGQKQKPRVIGSKGLTDTGKLTKW